MKRVVWVLLVCAGLLVSSAMTADASVPVQVTYHGAYWGYGSAWVNVVKPDGTLYSPTSQVGVGAQLAKIGIDGGSLAYSTSPLYCLDLYHWQANFSGDRYTVPPESHPTPPYNTDQAAWVYQKYGKDQNMQKGVQLALWEITHEADWYHWYGKSTHWYNEHENPGTGDPEGVGQFYFTTNQNPMIGHATTILDDLYENYGSLTWDRPAYYYRPDDTPGVGQGLMGDVPEPSTLLLMGGALLASVGVAWKRRKQG